VRASSHAARAASHSRGRRLFLDRCRAIFLKSKQTDAASRRPTRGPARHLLSVAMVGMTDDNDVAAFMRTLSRDHVDLDFSDRIIDCDRGGVLTPWCA